MIVSFDNVRYISGLSSQILTNFDFVFLNYNTYHIYEREIGMDENMINSKQDQKLKGLGFIFKSLSSNQK